MAMTFTYDDGYDTHGAHGSIRQVICTWTSNGSGAASGTTAKIVGELLKGVTNPGATAPTDNYDITLTDEDGANVLANCFDDLADRDTANSETVDFMLSSAAVTDPGGTGGRPCVCGPLTVAVANAGDTKDGVLRIYYKV